MALLHKLKSSQEIHDFNYQCMTVMKYRLLYIVTTFAHMGANLHEEL